MMETRMTREAAIAAATASFTSGRFRNVLSARVARQTESQNAERQRDIVEYLHMEMRPAFAEMGFTCEILEDPAARAPFLYAERNEEPGLTTVLGYGHGDVVNGLDAEWREDASPWAITTIGDRWYGRGVADNKGQHTINLEAMRAVLETRGRLGFNAKFIVDMGEEVGCPGLRELCTRHRGRFAADLLVASDGPRLSAERPTLFLGSRAALNIKLSIVAREGGHHSGNWGGLLSNPAIQLANAISCIVGPTGKVNVPGWLPREIAPSIKRALADCRIEADPAGPQIDETWGEPSLTLAEKVYGWCSFEVLAFKAGNPEAPVSAIPPSAAATCQLRFVADIAPEDVLPALRTHLDASGFGFVDAQLGSDDLFPATRLDPDDEWVRRVARSVEETTGKRPAVLPNFGGTLPNDIFSDVIGMRTIWVPHSYPGCSQHAPNEHVPIAIFEEGLQIMAGIYWDLGEPGFRP
jgi:acetylornithine deacetylase/succinyl-diaminopimelate desuccinylase-like protein